MNPFQDLLDWFNTIPRLHSDFLARMFFILSSEQTSDLNLTSEQARKKFLLYLSRPDFPPRSIARLENIKCIFSFIMNNKDFFMREDNPFIPRHAEKTGKISFLEPRQWEKTRTSWNQLLQSSLSPRVISAMLHKSSW